MAVGKSLLSLLQDFRIETGASANPAHNSNARDAQVRALQKSQEMLWERHAWPDLRVRRYIDLQAGQRFYDPRGAKLADGTPAADLGIKRLEGIEVRWGDEWTPLCTGVHREHYAAHDSDLDERSWPVERWQIYEDGMIEVWPVPEANADPATLDGRLCLTGIRDLRPLVADSDVADLDDTLIVKWAAVKPLAKQGSKDGQVVLDQAKRLEADLTGNFTKAKSFSLAGRSAKPERQSRFPPRVHYRTT